MKEHQKKLAQEIGSILAEFGMSPQDRGVDEIAQTLRSLLKRNVGGWRNRLRRWIWRAGDRN